MRNFILTMLFAAFVSENCAVDIGKIKKPKKEAFDPAAL